MADDDSPSPSTAAQRLAMKRARDRRAQQNARDKKNNRIAALEGQLAQCRRQNAAYVAQIQQLQHACEELRCSSAKMVTRQELVSTFVDSWQQQSRDALHAPQDPPGTSASTSSASTVLAHSADARFIGISDVVVTSAGCVTTISAPTLFSHHATTTAAAVEQSLQLSSQSPFIDPQLSAFSLPPALYTSHMFTIPLWGLTTLQSEPARADGVCQVGITWRADPELVRAVPEFPEAADLLFGNDKNYLSNTLHDAMQRTVICPDPERLACGWIDYLLWKWMLEPTEQRYLRLPDFLRPIAEQIQCPHPSAIDMIPWPRLRANLISHQDDYDLDKVIHVLARSYKVRWPLGESIVEPDDKGVIRIRPDFLNAFMSLDRWYITREFIHTYPELVEGMDPRHLMR